MLGKIIVVLKARWFITLIGALIMSFLIWFVGPLIAIADVRPLESDLVRFICVIVLLVVWGLINLFALMRAKKSNEKFIDEIAESPEHAAASDAAASTEEVAILKERLQEALGTLKRTKLGGKGGRQYLYELPWYILIGPPGSGKTTALVNSGLSFPLAEETGRDSLRGVGGTRNCDWWFTNEAVLLDTAGRYTTQDSQQTVDRAGWLGFLELLKKYRPRQPINGALVAISIADLSTMTESQRLGHARGIRQRIRELHDELGVRFPIYVLFTKADLIAGFVEFFDDLDREEREQVWGITLPMDEGGEEAALSVFGREFGALVERLNDRLVTRMHQEPDLQRRALMFGFPAQFASLKGIAENFLQEVFLPSRYEERPLLRGVYLTSGTQEGTPIDRIMSALAANFGIERQRLSAFSGTGRSYFLTRLLREVVFPEASIVGANRSQERRRRWMRRGALALGCMLTLTLAGIWYFSYLANRDLLAEVHRQMTQYEERVADLDMTNISDSNLVPILSPLNTLRQIRTGYEEQDTEPPLRMTFGLYQGEKVGSQAQAAYRRALNLLFLPRLLLRLEEQIQSNINRPEYLYESLRVYLMLGSQGPLDNELVREWLRLDWTAAYPGQENARGRESLLLHLNAMLARPLKQIPLNGPLIERSRQALRQMSFADRAYARIQQSQAARNLPEWRIIDHAGPAAERILQRSSGRALSEGIPGLYTYDGFHGVFLPAVRIVTLEVAKESWIFGSQGEEGLSVTKLRQVEKDLLSVYYTDYAAHWDRLLADIAITPFRSIAHAVESLNVLAGPNSPLRGILLAVVRETTLTPPPEGLTGAAEKVKQAAEAKLQSGGAVGRLAQIVGQTVQGEGPPGKFIDDRYKPLRDFVQGQNGAPSQMEEVIRLLNELYFQLNQVAASLSPEQTIKDLSKGGAGRRAIQQLASAATRIPPPVNAWLAWAAKATTTVTVGGARKQLNGIWVAEVLPMCRRALDNRYPLFSNDSAEVELDDFARLFAPGRLIDKFFNQNLRPFVDTSSRPWRWQRVDKVNLGIPRAVLAQFEYAAEIRDSFFSGGGDMQVRFELTPVVLDASATHVLLDIDGQMLTYSHGPPRATQFQWPGPSGASGVRLAFSPPLPDRQSSTTKNGPWAWFRMLDMAKVEASGLSDRFNVEFSVGGRIVKFALRARSVVNPFALEALGRFRCPGSL
jgi:type VI secretion system protein ImpL